MILVSFPRIWILNGLWGFLQSLVLAFALHALFWARLQQPSLIQHIYREEEHSDYCIREVASNDGWEPALEEIIAKARLSLTEDQTFSYKVLGRWAWTKRAKNDPVLSLWLLLKVLAFILAPEIITEELSQHWFDIYRTVSTQTASGGDSMSHE